MNYSKEYLIVFTANKKHILGRYFRTLVSARNLHKYIGTDNANKALEAIKNFKGDKGMFKYRKHGRIEFYSK